MESVIDNPNAIAVIGMSARFPGAPTLDEFWHNLAHGVESISFFTEQELRDSGVPEELIRENHYVPAASLLEGFDLFDARFFDFTPREAELTDPQHRLFLEVAWEAMEQAGYCGDALQAAVGVFAGAGPSACSYLGSDTHLNARLLGPAGSREHIGNDKDYLTTRVSYRLNLRGPSVCVQSACSTSLVAVHLACQSLLLGESDMALAGGVTVRVPQRKGYTARDNAICSPDGHCRAFDAAAEGTVFGSGVGVVVLKRLAQAMADGDTIRAVIRATASNNDGANKISYWASSAEGQVAALGEAIAVADIEPDTIGFVEAHGTGTTMGDPVEVMALTQAFRAGTERNGFCALGSVKTNVGHLDSAAGIVSLIKAILTLERRVIPPTLHFQTPNPRIKFEATPFYVNTEPVDWDKRDVPRRALVNALGIGGTNACAVLEEAPAVPDRHHGCSSPPFHLLPMSAKNAKALIELAERYLAYLERPNRAELVDICHTAACGRRHFAHRLGCVAASHEELRSQLASFLDQKTIPGVAQGQVPRGGATRFGLVFSHAHDRLLPTGLERLRSWPRFASTLQACDAAIRARTGTGLPTTLTGQASGAPGSGEVSPALIAFAVDYSLAKQWIEWSGVPAVVAGLGTGELTAACVAGLVTLEAAVGLLAQEGSAWAHELTGVEAACCPTWSAASASPLEEAWTRGRSYEEICRPPAEFVGPLTATVKNIQGLLHVGPDSGNWMTEAERQPTNRVVQLPGISDQGCPHRQMMQTLAKAYVLGASIDWTACYCGQVTRRVALPTYPFQKKRFWSEPVALGIDHLPHRPDSAADSEAQKGSGGPVYLATDPAALIYERRLNILTVDDAQRVCSELIADAWKSFHGDQTFEVRALAVRFPDLCGDRCPWVLQLTLSPSADAVHDVTVYCREQNASRPVTWRTLATATVTANA